MKKYAVILSVIAGLTNSIAYAKTLNFSVVDVNLPTNENEYAINTEACSKKWNGFICQYHHCVEDAGLQMSICNLVAECVYNVLTNTNTCHPVN